MPSSSRRSSFGEGFDLFEGFALDHLGQDGGGSLAHGAATALLGDGRDHAVGDAKVDPYLIAAEGVGVLVGVVVRVQRALIPWVAEVVQDDLAVDAVDHVRVLSREM
jgi:hypothetical protein